MRFSQDGNALVCRRQGELLRIEPWGRDALRIRATMYPDFTGEEWALTERPEPVSAEIVFSEEMLREGDGTTRAYPLATITNGRIRATVNHGGVLTLYRDDWMILREHFRNYSGSITKESHCLKVVNREWTPYTGGDYRLTVRFEPNDGEKLYGMGQYQQPYMDLKGCTLELAQKNSQTTVPFLISSLGYGMLWNNPAVGEVSFSKNLTQWTAACCRDMDYWVAVAEDPKELLYRYTAVTGRAPMMPEEMMGFWQCKLRYRTQEEVLQVARRYQELGIKLDVIIIDFFHWTLQGDWKFDSRYWPDPRAMVEELHRMGIRVLVSVWPSVDRRSENFEEMVDRGLLMRTERGAMQTYDYQGDCVEIDPFNPETREYVWEKCREHYYALGIDGFWLDNSEPDLTKYDFDNFRYYAGPALRCSNIYPQMYSRTFDDPMRALGVQPVNLLRSGWAGSQKYGNVLWSGDVPSTWESMRDQLQAGLNMGLAGIPWWNTDIGGFMEGNVFDPDFRELLVRWYEWAVFQPVMRLHGDREPFTIPPLDERTMGGGYLHTGQDNEMWSYGEEIYAIMRDHYELRQKMRPYIRRIYEEAHTSGSPLMRAMFYEFPEDPICWDLADQYMFGPDYLVAPVMTAGARERPVYLPVGTWRDIRTGMVLSGGDYFQADAPIESIPVFERVRE
ncbi:MAG: glycoside hydrolase family 31 protein [Clostridia bacterium]|nr:glycoside hydrolase family 31 protein [Clostridia bacterium]